MAVLGLREALLRARKPVVGKVFLVYTQLPDGDKPHRYFADVLAPLGGGLWHVRIGNVELALGADDFRRQLDDIETACVEIGLTVGRC